MLLAVFHQSITKMPYITVDKDLLALSEIWAAAGSPFAGFCLTPNQLVELTNGQVEIVV